jgi:hypothetical protein
MNFSYCKSLHCLIALHIHIQFVILPFGNIHILHLLLMITINIILITLLILQYVYIDDACADKEVHDFFILFDICMIT